MIIILTGNLLRRGLIAGHKDSSVAALQPRRSSEPNHLAERSLVRLFCRGAGNSIGVRSADIASLAMLECHKNRMIGIGECKVLL